MKQDQEVSDSGSLEFLMSERKREVWREEEKLFAA